MCNAQDDKFTQHSISPETKTNPDPTYPLRGRRNWGIQRDDGKDVKAKSGSNIAGGINWIKRLPHHFMAGYSACIDSDESFKLKRAS